MCTTNLKPVQLEALYHEAINLAMSGNAGIAIVKLRKAFPDAKLHALNVYLIDIEIQARREMRKKITDAISNF